LPIPTSSPSQVVDIQSPSLQEILSTLEKQYPCDTFMNMLAPLQEAGMKILDEILLHGGGLIVECTGLPKHKVMALCEYSCCLKVLDHIGGRATTEDLKNDATAGDEKEHDNEHDTDKDSGIVKVVN
jgi:hypothetical protein